MAVLRFLSRRQAGLVDAADNSLNDQPQTRLCGYTRDAVSPFVGVELFLGGSKGQLIGFLWLFVEKKTESIAHCRRDVNKEH